MWKMEPEEPGSVWKMEPEEPELDVWGTELSVGGRSRKNRKIFQAIVEKLYRN